MRDCSVTAQHSLPIFPEHPASTAVFHRLPVLLIPAPGCFGVDRRDSGSSGFVSRLILAQIAKEMVFSLSPCSCPYLLSFCWHEHQPSQGTDPAGNCLLVFSLSAGLVFRRIRFLIWQIAQELILAPERTHDPTAGTEIS